MTTDERLGTTLLVLARNAIARELGLPEREIDRTDENSGELSRLAATFVTLQQDARLRGCIGTLQAYRPLAEDIQQNARAAAFSDPRFRPLEAREFPLIRVEVSVLTPPAPLRFSSEADALSQMCPGIDGIIFSVHGRRATFLPQVWDDLPEPGVFMRHLKQKAGMPANYWGSEVVLERYLVDKWKETDFR